MSSISSLTEEQERAVALTLAPYPLVVLTGGPGTGKSFVVREIVSAHEKLRHRVALAAPTGKAARRLSEATSREARTLHRLLEFLPEDPLLMEELGKLPTGTSSFRRGLQNPLDADIVVVDEASMIDVRLMRALMRACDRDKTRLVLVGDADQLPPVGPGAPFQDIVASGAVPLVKLTKIHRQAEGSLIVQNAHKILRGEADFLQQAGEDFYFVERPGAEAAAQEIIALVSEKLPKERGFDPIRDIQVLSPQNGGPLGTEALSLGLQQTLNPGAPGSGAKTLVGELRPGDRVIQIRNDYTRGVMNGEWGQVESLDTEALRVDLGDRSVVYPRNDVYDLALAYAMTVHRAQGSEYRAVVAVISSAQAYMLSRTLLYTAITRGRELVVVVGDARGVGRAVANTTSNRRRTLLRALLTEKKQA